MSTTQEPHHQKRRAPPIGVKVLSGLTMLAGVLMVIGGLTAMVLVPATPSMFTGMVPPEHMHAIPTVFALTGSVSVVIGLASGLVAVGLYKGKGWAWRTLTIVAFAGIAIAALSVAMGHVGEIASLIINGVIIYYLYRPHVKQYFGKVEDREATMAQAS